MNRALTLLVSSTLTMGLLAAPSPASAGETAPPVTKKLAKKMKCRYSETTGLMGGGPNDGIKCRVTRRVGRQTIYVLKYRNLTRALDHWREWTEAYNEEDEPGYIARKGKILIIPMGGGSGEDDNPYTLKWATYAAVKLGGRVIPGYPA